MDDAFALADGRWTPVSPRLRALRRTVTLAAVAAGGLLAVGATGALALAADTATGLGALLGVLAVVLAVVLVVMLIGWRLVGRNYASWGYSERADDMLVRHGWLFRRLVVVPYGRMQFVDVTAGPLQRRFGVATLQLHTAAAATDATVPGLPPGEAARLRDALAAAGEARSTGL